MEETEPPAGMEDRAEPEVWLWELVWMESPAQTVLEAMQVMAATAAQALTERRESLE